MRRLQSFLLSRGFGYSIRTQSTAIAKQAPNQHRLLETSNSLLPTGRFAGKIWQVRSKQAQLIPQHGYTSFSICASRSINSLEGMRFIHSKQEKEHGTDIPEIYGLEPTSEFLKGLTKGDYMTCYKILTSFSGAKLMTIRTQHLQRLCQGLLAIGETHKARSVLDTIKRAHPDVYQSDPSLVDAMIYSMARVYRWDAVFDLYNDRMAMNLKPPMETHLTALKACIQTKRCKEAVSILDLVRAEDPHLVPTEDVLRLFASDGRWDLCVYFLQEAREQKVPITQKTIIDLTNKYVEARSFGLVENLPQTLLDAIPPDQQSIAMSQLLRRSVVTGTQKNVTTFVERTFELGIPITEDLLVSFANSYKSVHGLDNMVGYMENLFQQKNITPGKSYLTTVCESYIASENPTKAMETVKRMWQDSHTPPLVMLEGIARVCGKKCRLDLGMELVELMKKANMEPSVIFFTALLHGGAKSENLSFCLDVLRLMQKNSVNPDSVALSVLIDACGKSRDYKKASEIFNMMKELGLPVGVVTYNSLLNAYCKAGLADSCIRLFQEIEEKGLEPTETTFGIMISALSRQSSIKMCRIYLDNMKHRNLSPNLYVYNSYLDACARMGEYDESIRIMEEMKTQNIKADIITYTNLIRTFASTNKPEMGIALFNNIRAKGLEPNTKLYSGVLKLFEQNGDYERAYTVLQDMKANKCSIDHGIFSSLLYTLGRSNLRDKVWDLLAESKTCNLVLTSYEVSNYFRGLISSSQYTHAFKALKEIHRNKAYAKMRPQSFIYDRLVDYFSKHNDSKAAIELMELMRSNQTKVDHQTYFQTLENFLQMGRRVDIERLISHGKQRRVKLQDKELNQLRSICQTRPDGPQLSLLLESLQ